MGYDHRVLMEYHYEGPLSYTEITLYNPQEVLLQPANGQCLKYPAYNCHRMEHLAKLHNLDILKFPSNAIPAPSHICWMYASTLGSEYRRWILRDVRFLRSTGTSHDGGKAGADLDTYGSLIIYMGDILTQFYRRQFTQGALFGRSNIAHEGCF